MRFYRVVTFIIIILLFALFSCELPEGLKPLAEKVNPHITEYKNMSFSYYYDTLDEDEKTIYAQIYDSAISLEDSVDIYNLKSPSSELVNILSCVLLDHPEIFWLDTGLKVTASLIGEAEIGHSIEFMYLVEKDKIPEMQKKIDITCNRILDDMPQDLSEYEKVKFIYEKVISFIDFDVETYSSMENTKEPSYTLYGALGSNLAVCSGYCASMQYLLTKLDIPCTTINGHSIKSAVRHAWNLVKIEGDYYYIDATWGDPVTLDGSQSIINYDYFCITTSELLSVQIPDIDTLPLCTATKYNYYVYNNLYFKTYDYQALKKAVKEKITDKPTELAFKFADIYSYNEAIGALISNNGIFTILEDYPDVIVTDILNYTVIQDRFTIKLYLEYK